MLATFFILQTLTSLRADTLEELMAAGRTRDAMMVVQTVLELPGATPRAKSEIFTRFGAAISDENLGEEIGRFFGAHVQDVRDHFVVTGSLREPYVQLYGNPRALAAVFAADLRNAILLAEGAAAFDVSPPGTLTEVLRAPLEHLFAPGARRWTKAYSKEYASAARARGFALARREGIYSPRIVAQALIEARPKSRPWQRWWWPNQSVLDERTAALGYLAAVAAWNESISGADRQHTLGLLIGYAGRPERTATYLEAWRSFNEHEVLADLAGSHLVCIWGDTLNEFDRRCLTKYYPRVAASCANALSAR